MCLIIDANRISSIVNRDEDSVPILEWLLEDKSQIALGGSKIRNEYSKHAGFFRYIGELEKSGKVRIAKDENVDAEEINLLQSKDLSSDDHHVIALARVTGCRLVYSSDMALHGDFKNPRILRPKGKVYQYKSHKNLLKNAPRCR